MDNCRDISSRSAVASSAILRYILTSSNALRYMSSVLIFEINLLIATFIAVSSLTVRTEDMF